MLPGPLVKGGEGEAVQVLRALTGFLTGTLMREIRMSQTYAGGIPALTNPPPGCRFHPRCRHAVDECRRLEPEPVSIGTGHSVACHLYQGGRPA